VTIDVYQNVFWFDIPVDNVHIMQMLQPEQKFSEVKLSLALGKPLYFPKMEEHLSSSAKVHYEK
jgi:hypothetical protein